MQPVDPLYDSRKTTKVCELEDGAICEYDVCDTHRYGDYDSKLFKCSLELMVCSSFLVKLAGNVVFRTRVAQGRLCEVIPCAHAW